ncbi:MAG: indole-3-glycerol phosphate synthase TrpC [Lachnospiraceae bacterium]|nr:indole-3-glycerol phosphate synthase TrpC [Lachnospiraceae bacterium]
MILDKIVQSTRKRVERDKERQNLEEVKAQALAMDTRTQFPFEKMLWSEGISFICEVKKASPSKGLIAPDFPYLDIAREYERVGAGAISVLTEPEFFQGSPEYLKEIRQEVEIPLLRKDFIVDAYQIYQAKVLGADAALLICAILDGAALREYIELCDHLGLSALVEAHDEREMEQALLAGARIIGVNNRNLKDFTVDIGNSVRLRRLAPDEVAFVAESGIQTRQDVESLEEASVNAVLIGETLMRSPDKKAMLEKLRGKIP